MSKPTECTLFTICTNDPFSETPLMKPLPYDGSDVCPTRVVGFCHKGLVSYEPHGGVIDGYLERKGSRIIAYDVHRPRGEAPTGREAVEVDQRYPLLHCLPQADIVSTKGIGAAVFVEKIAVTAELFFVGPFLAMSLSRGDGRDNAA